jgi:predicted aspartyl protease
MKSSDGYGSRGWWACLRTAALASLLMMSAASSALGACQLVKIGELAVSVRGVPVVAASLDGHSVRLIVDTGAYNSLLFRAAVTAFNLKRLGVQGQDMLGTGGRDSSELVSVRDFALGDSVVHDLRFLAVAGAAGTKGFAPEDLAGVLGEDFLSSMDVEFDLASGKIRLFHPKSCSGDQVVYWASAYNMVKFVAPPAGTRWLEAYVSLNGKDALAMFDSGASRSTVTTNVSQRSGMEPETAVAESGQARGIGPKTVTFSVARFASLTIGQELIKNPSLAIGDLFGATREVHTGSYIRQSAVTEPDLIVGADFLRVHRVYIATGQGKMYFTYLGGPIFEHAEPAPAPDAAPGTASVPGDSPKPPEH